MSNPPTNLVMLPRPIKKYIGLADANLQYYAIPFRGHSHLKTRQQDSLPSKVRSKKVSF